MIKDIVDDISTKAEKQHLRVYAECYGTKTGPAIRALTGELCFLAKRGAQTACAFSKIINLEVSTEERLTKFYEFIDSIEIASEEALWGRLEKISQNKKATNDELFAIRAIIQKHLQSVGSKQ